MRPPKRKPATIVVKRMIFLKGRGMPARKLPKMMPRSVKIPVRWVVRTTAPE